MSYPATFEVERPERMANWRPLVQYIMSIPTWIVLHSALNIVATITVIYAWLSVLVTGKQPPGLVAFHATYVRFRARTFSVSVWIIANVAAIFGLLAVTFTGRWPESMYRVCAGWVRVDARLWAYAMLLTDDYPPFSLD